ncbi:MAG TPA: hypothetical protein DDW84_06920 [Phycisphaerales bacterium]|nr:MAG: hypothetical protein A2Y13_03550 [Planctomycetes bacterium GWC2_45_44]HBG78555.1 hypothetical protein [Phycisphaerales bacterium]HBR20903.1 hypothetical protein [Phycisphaerales bacterium]
MDKAVISRRKSLFRDEIYLRFSPAENSPPDGRKFRNGMRTARKTTAWASVFAKGYDATKGPTQT